MRVNAAGPHQFSWMVKSESGLAQAFGWLKDWWGFDIHRGLAGGGGGETSKLSSFRLRGFQITWSKLGSD